MLFLQGISWLFIIAMFFFRKKRNVKILFVVICITLLSPVLLNPTTTSIRNWCILCFFITEVKYYNIYISVLKNKVVGKTLFIVLFSNILSALFSPNIYGSFSGIKDFVIGLLSCHFLIIYSYLSISSKKQLCLFYNVLYYCIIVLTTFAIFNLFFKSAFFVNYVTSYENVERLYTESLGDIYMDSDRFRVQAMFINPFDYGYICLVYFFIELYAFITKVQDRKKIIVGFLCCLFGIFTCGCRTVLACFFLGLLSLLTFIFSKNSKKIIYVLFSIVIVIFMYNAFPVFQSKLDLMFTAVTDAKGAEVGGSNINMRQQQLNAVLFHIKDNLLFGRGVGFFGKDLGYNSGELRDMRLMGLEGVYMNYLLERGFVGLFFWILYYFMLLRYFYKRRLKDRYTSAIGITIIIVYISFGCMTGQLLSLYPTLLSLGLLLKICDSNKINKRRYFSKKNNTNSTGFGFIKQKKCLQ